MMCGVETEGFQGVKTTAGGQPALGTREDEEAEPGPYLGPDGVESKRTGQGNRGG